MYEMWRGLITKHEIENVCHVSDGNNTVAIDIGVLLIEIRGCLTDNKIDGEHNVGDIDNSIFIDITKTIDGDAAVGGEVHHHEIADVDDECLITIDGCHLAIFECDGESHGGNR